jgi:arylsulfatase A-like enzyme
MKSILEKASAVASPHYRALGNSAAAAAAVAAALYALSFVGKIHAVYHQVSRGVIIIAALWIALYLMKQFPFLDKARRIAKITLLSLAGVLMALLVFMVIWYTYFFFPDDGEYLQGVLDGAAHRGGAVEEVELDLIRGLSRAVVVNPLTGDDRDYLLGDGPREKEFYLDRNPYDRTGHPNNIKYSTGRIFYYTSQKNSLALKRATRIEYRLDASAGERFLEFDAVFPSLDGNAAEGVLKVSYAGAGTTVLLEKKISRERKPEIAPFRYSNVLSSLSFYLRHPGMSVLPDYTGWERHRVAVPPGAGRLVLEFDAPGERPYLFLGSPRVFVRADRPRGGHLNVAYIIFDCLAKNHIDLYEFPELFAAHSPEEAMRRIGPRNTITPSLDRYAKEALLFDNMYSVGQVTRPSIVGLWTSRSYTESRLPVFRNIVTRENQEEFHDLKFATPADELSRRGYFTRQISCNAQGHGVSSVGVDLGFEENYDYTMEASEHPENIRRIIEFFQENQNRKFLLYAHINTPHSPSWIPLGYYLRALWDTNFIHSSARTLGNIRYLNHHLDMLLRAAEKLRLHDNTLFIITADHSFGRDHLFRTTVTEEEKLWARQESMQVAYFHGKAVYVRKGGPNLLRHTMNIPFVVIPPRSGAFRPGKVASTVSMLDVAPTILDLAAGASHPRFSGKSFRSLLTDEEGRDTVFSRFIPMTGRFKRAFLLDGRYKYAVNLPGLYRYREEGGKKYIMQQEYLFDLAEDPGEINNLALDGKNPELLSRMRKIYREKFVDYPDKNFIQITPFDDGRAAEYRITVQAAGAVIHPGTFLDTMKFSKQGPGRIVFSASITDKPGILSFETDPPAAPLEISVYRDGTLIPGGEIYSSVENINIFGNPIRLTGLWDFHVARDHARTGLEAAKVPPGAVHYCRVPLNYWLEMSKSDKDIKLSPGIKEVLRGWGYIQ